MIANSFLLPLYSFCDQVSGNSLFCVELLRKQCNKKVLTKQYLPNPDKKTQLNRSRIKMLMVVMQDLRYDELNGLKFEEENDDCEGYNRLYGVVLVMHWRSRASQMVDLIHF